MGGKMRSGGNVIQFPANPEQAAKERPDLGRLKPAPEGLAKILAVPPKTLSVHAAMRELAKIIAPLDHSVYTRLGFHRKVKFSSYPEGVEFYDLSSKRPEPRAPGETLANVDSWVRLWYFSVFDSGKGVLVGRYIDRNHPDFLDGHRLGLLEHEITRPGLSPGAGLNDFIELLHRH